MKEKHLKINTKSCQSRRKTSEVKRTLKKKTKITDKPIQKIVNSQQDNKLVQFTVEEPDAVLKKINEINTEKL